MLRYIEFGKQGGKSKKVQFSCFGWVVVPLSAAGALQTIGCPKKTDKTTNQKEMSDLVKSWENSQHSLG